MKPNPKKPIVRQRGFALVVTLSLMILLTVIAVGLLSLSTISLRSTGQVSALAAARANAKLALMLAIGDLQKSAGPDKRITAPANLISTAAPAGVTGVWKSAKPSFSNPDYVSTKTGDNFLGYLMSNATPADVPDPKSLPTGSAKQQPLVGPKSVGPGNSLGEISAPLLPISTKTGSASGGVSWVTLDEGVKGRIDLLPSKEPSSQGEAVTQVGSPARNGFESVEKMDFLKADRSELLATLPKLVSLNEANLSSGSTDATARYFHDFTVTSNSLQVDVANGGLKTDLSVAFDGDFGSDVPSPFATKYVYSDTDTPFQGASTSSDVQWSLYANYSRLYRRTTNNDNPKVGIKAVLPPQYSVKSISDETLKQRRFEPNMETLKQPVLMPTVLRVDTVFTIVTRDAHHGHGTSVYPYMLHLMYLPVITLHNPYNVPLRVTNLQVEFSDIPIGFEFLVNNQPASTSGLLPINQFYTNSNVRGAKKTFNMGLSESLTSASEVVMGPGETRLFGTPFPATTNWTAEVNNNGAQKGFLFDWQSNQTAGALTTPGMITGQNDGVGFNVDWLAPNNRAAWLNARKNNGVIILKADDRIQVRYGPVVPATASSTNSFTVAVKLSTANVGTTQVFYANANRLKTIMEEGTSERFPGKRTFPDTWPRDGESAKTTMDIHEANGTPVKDYARARPFAIFSVSAKTTRESFTRSRPVADTGIAFQMATCDFTTSESQGSSPLEFALVPVKSGGLVIESGGITDSRGTSQQGFFFGGHGSTHGSANATIYEIPVAPLQSIAQLRHANAGSLGSIPYVTYTVGESRAHPAVPSDVAFHKADSSRTVLDRTWLANDQMWDRYWFSTLSTLQGTAYAGSAAKTQQNLADEFFSGAGNLPNQRNAAYVPSGKPPTEVASSAIAGKGAQTAAYVLTQGGFNVNSTSIPAWTSVLSALATSDVPLAAGSTDKDPSGTPFLRMRQPVAGLSTSLTPNEKLWNTYRTLDNQQIQKLAEEIVAEVKARGPFLSMGEFVNRRLGSAGPLTTAGAIQAALDRTGINAVMESNALAVSPAEVSGYGWKNEDAVTGNTGAGAPGEVSQGDVLSAIGSFVSVRSDTFRIRAFGDARNAAGVVIARAWCEATVQRVPEYVDPTDAPNAAANALAPVNLAFGRQFRTISFRWLHTEEI